MDNDQLVIIRTHITLGISDTVKSFPSHLAHHRALMNADDHWFYGSQPITSRSCRTTHVMPSKYNTLHMTSYLLTLFTIEIAHEVHNKVHRKKLNK